VNRRSVGAKVLAVTALKAHHATEKAVNEAQDLLSFYSNCRIHFDCRARKRPAVIFGHTQLRKGVSTLL
jgi:hypothetical protein